MSKSVRQRSRGFTPRFASNEIHSRPPRKAPPEALEAGADRVLGKVAPPDEVFATIRELGGEQTMSMHCEARRETVWEIQMGATLGLAKKTPLISVPSVLGSPRDNHPCVCTFVAPTTTCSGI